MRIFANLLCLWYMFVNPYWVIRLELKAVNFGFA